MSPVNTPAGGFPGAGPGVRSCTGALLPCPVHTAVAGPSPRPSGRPSVAAMSLPPSIAALLDGLVAAGLHDDAARLGVRLTSAHADLSAARSAEAALTVLQEELRPLFAEAQSLAAGVRAGVDVAWRSEAGRRHADTARALHVAAEDRVDEVLEWLALLQGALHEAGQARADAERRVRQAEETATVALRTLAAVA